MSVLGGWEGLGECAWGGGRGWVSVLVVGEYARTGGSGER